LDAMVQTSHRDNITVIVYFIVWTDWLQSDCWRTVGILV